MTFFWKRTATLERARDTRQENSHLTFSEIQAVNTLTQTFHKLTGTGN